MQSMTGFGSKELEVAPYGKITLELKSSNHKFLETVFHVPDGFLSLEDKIKKAIEARIKRGRLICAMTTGGIQTPRAFVNKELIKNYISTLKKIKGEFGIKDEINISTLIHLPGVLSFEASNTPKQNIWPRIKLLVNGALEELLKTRNKEGKALYGYLKTRQEALNTNLGFIKKRFKKAVKAKLKTIVTDEERTGFLKESDITEEIERLAFHIRNFKNKLGKSGPIGKELDFIAQEMQREANTLGAKTFDLSISARVVQIKSQIEKIREQVQNIE